MKYSNEHMIEEGKRVLKCVKSKEGQYPISQLLKELKEQKFPYYTSIPSILRKLGIIEDVEVISRMVYCRTNHYTRNERDFLLEYIGVKEERSKEYENYQKKLISAKREIRKELNTSFLHKLTPILYMLAGGVVAWLLFKTVEI